MLQQPVHAPYAWSPGERTRPASTILLFSSYFSSCLLIIVSWDLREDSASRLTQIFISCSSALAFSFSSSVSFGAAGKLCFPSPMFFEREVYRSRNLVGDCFTDSTDSFMIYAFAQFDKLSGTTHVSFQFSWYIDAKFQTDLMFLELGGLEFLFIFRSDVLSSRLVKDRRNNSDPLIRLCVL